jgi:NADPH:quinone reductase-like Zn-dependent oxidoreductase
MPALESITAPMYGKHFRMEDSPTSSPGADEIAIKVLASPINPADINMVRQSLKTIPFHIPFLN